MTCPKAFRRFTRAEGAEGHCEGDGAYRVLDCGVRLARHYGALTGEIGVLRVNSMAGGPTNLRCSTGQADRYRRGSPLSVIGKLQISSPGHRPGETPNRLDANMNLDHFDEDTSILPVD